jgi:glycosyltransferase involved in cell wall biosynthesis
MRVIAVVPAYNEEQTVAGVIRALQPVADAVIVVDDGSTDDTAAVARRAGAQLIRHTMNRGLGAALGTGIAAARELGAEVIVTFDADGQHQAEDFPRVCAPILAGEADCVLGCRTLEREKMPPSRQLANWIGNALTWALFGLWVQDSQSGLRAFSRPAAERLEIRSNRMEVSSEIVKEIKRHGWRLTEVPIKTVYTEYSLSKGQGFLVGLKTAGKLLLRRLDS